MYMCALDGQKLVQITLSALQLMRTDNDYKLSWPYMYVEQRKSKVEGVSSPVLVRHKKVPKRFKIGDTDSEQQFSSVENHYRAIYFEAIDTVIGTIKNRCPKCFNNLKQCYFQMIFFATSQRWRFDRIKGYIFMSSNFGHPYTSVH